MTMGRARIAIVLMGLSIPYLARLPRGIDWLRQYTHGGVDAALFLAVCGAVTWGALLALSLLYRRAASLIPAAVLAFGFLAWAHATLDLSADAQASLALIFIPLYSLLFVAVGGLIGLAVERYLARNQAARKSV